MQLNIFTVIIGLVVGGFGLWLLVWGFKRLMSGL